MPTGGGLHETALAMGGNLDFSTKVLEKSFGKVKGIVSGSRDAGNNKMKGEGVGHEGVVKAQINFMILFVVEALSDKGYKVFVRFILGYFFKGLRAGAGMKS